MTDSNLSLVVSEYYILWEALKHYEERLDKLSSMSTDEDQQLKYDEKLQDIQNLLKLVQIAANSQYSLELK